MLVLAGCRGGTKERPELDALRQPSGLAMSPDGRWLFVTGGNWDQVEEGGTLLSFDLQRLHAGRVAPAGAGADTSDAQPCRLSNTASVAECDPAALVGPGVILGDGIGDMVLDPLSRIPTGAERHQACLLSAAKSTASRIVRGLTFGRPLTKKGGELNERSAIRLWEFHLPLFDCPGVTAVEQFFEIAVTQRFLRVSDLCSNLLIVDRSINGPKYAHRFREFRMTHLSQQECQTRVFSTFVVEEQVVFRNSAAEFHYFRSSVSVQANSFVTVFAEDQGLPCSR